MEAMRKVEVLRAACCVAGVDGDTSDAEKRILMVLAEEVGVGEASLTAMIERANSDQAFYKEMFRVLKGDPGETMRLLFSIAVADNRFRSSEREVLRRLGRRLGIEQEAFDKWLKESIEYVQQRQAATKGAAPDGPSDDAATTT